MPKNWSVKLQLQGPIITASSTPGGMGVDVPFARNSAGKYYIPGTLVKGKLKESWTELRELLGPDAAPDPLIWIGRDPEKDPDSQLRGDLQWSDFVCEQSPTKPSIRYRIKMDNVRGSVETSMNLMIESPFPEGEIFEFTGRVSTVKPNVPANFERKIREGLRYVQSFGAEAGIGFGRTHQVKVGRINPSVIHGGGWENFNAGEASFIPIAIEPQGSFCVGGARIANNIFESSQTITGGVIKGALAQLLSAAGQMTPEFSEIFSRVRFLHAKPVKADGSQNLRPVAKPLSLYFAHGALNDASLIPEPFLDGATAPAFAPDWKYKDWQSVDEGRFPSRVPMELRVRTAINGELARNLDKSLFAYRLVSPAEHRWLSSIDLSGLDVQERNAMVATLRPLLHDSGLPGVGKLKTHCKVHYRPWTATSQSSLLPLNGNTWIVTLQTPALLIAASQFVNPFDREELLTKLREYWASLLGGLTLSHFYGSFDLAGGQYLNLMRRQAAYEPYVLMNEGSVFVLQSDSTDAESIVPAQRQLQSLIDHGLPIGPGPKAAFNLTGQPGDWERCPYIPQNGFGEIAVNQQIHSELQPDMESIHAA